MVTCTNRNRRGRWRRDGRARYPGDRNGGGRARRARVALLISVIAAMLALVEVSGGNAEQDATTNNITAANLWAFYQAKTIRRSNLQQLTELVELELPHLAAERAERTRKRLEAWRATAERYESEPETNEGRKQLAARAKAAEEARDRALAADNMFD